MLKIILTIIFFSLTLTGHSLGKEKTFLEGDIFEIDGQKKIIDARGNILLRRGKITIEAKSAQYLQREEEIILKGNIKIYFEDIFAESKQAHYKIKPQSVTLTGNPEVLRGPDKVKGKKITLFIKNKKIIIEGQTKLILNERNF